MTAKINKLLKKDKFIFYFFIFLYLPPDCNFVK